MVFENKESIQLLNTAIIKSKEGQIDGSYEERLGKTCTSPAIKAISLAVTHLAETEKISRDQAAVQIVETVKDLDRIWSDYVMMEGINNLKGLLKGDSAPHS